jgi:hypothetical protein
MLLSRNYNKHRPITETGERVPPSDLSEHRTSHDFKVPCCLCACDAAAPQYVESEIYTATEGPFWGEYVAGCAADRCGYLGQSRFRTRYWHV